MSRERTSRIIAQLVAGTYRLLLPPIKKIYTPEDPATGAHQVHELILKMSAIMDASAVGYPLIRKFYELVYEPQQGEFKAGGVVLPSDLILAAGWVKGLGFETEAAAVAAVEAGVNIIPGYSSVAHLTGGVVEMGSFTRFPRLGNQHPSMWRLPDGSLQQRVGLTNPGAMAAAEFLSQPHVYKKLPEVFGINIAVTPGLETQDQELQDVSETFAFFLQYGIIPSWFTLNVSCPNTEDDPSGKQAVNKVKDLCEVALEQIEYNRQVVPLWVKLSSALSDVSYSQLLQLFSHLGIKAVIVSNTRPEPAPHDPNVLAGVSGRKLHQDAVSAIQRLVAIKEQLHISNVDIIACGGVEDGTTYLNFGDEVAARQFLTVLLFRGPTAAALIREEARKAGKSNRY